MYCQECHGVQGPQGPYTCHCGKVDNYYHEWAVEFANLVVIKMWVANLFDEPKNYEDTKNIVLELLVNLEPEIKKLKFFSKVP